jgi:hypothetical protein
MGSAAVTGGTQANSCTLWRLSRHAQSRKEREGVGHTFSVQLDSSASTRRSHNSSSASVGRYSEMPGAVGEQ